MNEMSFEDLMFLLNNATKETITEFGANIQTYLKQEDIFSLLEFITQYDKQLLEKLKLDKTINKILQSEELLLN